MIFCFSVLSMTVQCWVAAPGGKWQPQYDRYSKNVLLLIIYQQETVEFCANDLTIFFFRLLIWTTKLDTLYSSFNYKVYCIVGLKCDWLSDDQFLCFSVRCNVDRVLTAGTKWLEWVLSNRYCVFFVVVINFSSLALLTV